MKTSFLLLALLLLRVASFAGSSWFVSPAGGGDGTRRSPWSLTTAFAHPSSVRPGDTIWVKGGEYDNPHPGPVSPAMPRDGVAAFVCALAGTPSQPIIVRAVTGERVMIDGMDTRSEAVIRIIGHDVWLWGLEIFSSDVLRVEMSDPYGNTSFPDPREVRRGAGIDITQDAPTGGIRIINCIIHDCTIGYLNTSAVSADAVLYGSLLFNNGFNSTIDRPHGHNIYVQNYAGHIRAHDNNIVWGAYENNVQAYGGDAALRNADDFVFDHTIAFAAGEGRDLLVGAASVANNTQLRNNYTYEPGGKRNLDLGFYPYGAGLNLATVAGNVFVGGETTIQWPVTNSAIVDNTFRSLQYLPDSIPRVFPVNSYGSGVPDQVCVVPNLYEPGRANIAVFNGARSPYVHADLSVAGLHAGDEYVLLDAQDFFGTDALDFRYIGGPVDIPMTPRTVGQPVGGDTQNGARVSTLPLFGSFVLLPKGSVPKTIGTPAFRWHAFSLAKMPADPSVGSVFPAISAVAYGWDNGNQRYVAAGTLQAGQGYFILLSDTDSAVVSGGDIGPFTVVMPREGWILLGSRSVPVALSAFQISPSDAIDTPLYLYNPQASIYAETSFLTPGAACWVHVKKPCTILVP